MIKKHSVIGTIALAGAIIMSMSVNSLASPYTVAKGDNLWKIAREKLGDGKRYVEIFEANKDQISDPARIFVGQVFEIPDGQSAPEKEIAPDPTPAPAPAPEVSESTEKIILGNIITMDENKPRAEAVAIRDGIIVAVGSEEEVRSAVSESAEVMDYKGQSVYPGFLEAHCHVLGTGALLDTDSVANLASGNSNEEYIALLAEFIKTHPEKELYQGSGFVEKEVNPTAAMIDAVCPDKPVVIYTQDGHSMWMNTAAMEKFGIDKEAVKKYGEDMVRVDDKGNPTGYISEAPVFEIRSQIGRSKEDGMRSLLLAQDFYFSKGYTAVYDAGLELVDKNCIEFYRALSNEGKLKLRTYSGSVIDENCEDIKGAVENVVKMKATNSEYFKVIGVKTFADGVIEAHTAYLLDEYSDQPGYYGAQRMTDDMLKELYTEAAKNDINVHVHSIGDASVRSNLNAIEAAMKATGKTDLRNAISHLQVVNEDDYKRFADLDVIAVVAPLWAPKDAEASYQQEVDYVGEERAEASYPIKSFPANGAKYAFHTDYPITRAIDVPKSVYTAVLRRGPDQTDESARKADEFLTRYQALLGLTKNVAYMWHEEDRMGSIEIGKLANLTVYDSDFLNDDLEKVVASKLISTIVDGEIVYKAK